MQLLWRAGAVRKRRVLSKAAKDASLHTEIAKRCRAVGGEFILGHVVAHCRPRRTIGNNGEVVRALHQGEFRRRFEHATAGSNRRGAHEFQLRRGLANSVVKKEADAFLYANAPGPDSAIAKDLGDAPIWTLVLLPSANVSAELDQLARAFFLELRTDPREFAALRNDDREHAFAGAPAHAGEIEHAGARLDIHCLDLLLAHQPLRFGDARAPFVVSDRDDAVSNFFQPLDRLGNFR